MPLKTTSSYPLSTWPHQPQSHPTLALSLAVSASRLSRSSVICDVALASRRRRRCSPPPLQFVSFHDWQTDECEHKLCWTHELTLPSASTRSAVPQGVTPSAPTAFAMCQAQLQDHADGGDADGSLQPAFDLPR